jgi:SAM-dependent methyltransferase
MHSIKINSDRGILELKYLNFENLKLYVKHQIDHLYNLSDQEFHVELSNTLQRHWDRKIKLGLFDFTNTINVLDIGSGVGFLDLLLHKYLNNGSKFYLVDESKYTPEPTQFKSTNSFYNDWSVFEDLIEHSDISRSDFTLLSTSDEWPEKLDMIMSNHSYMFHYPKELYWEKVIKTIKSNKCRLAFDVLNLKDRDVVKEITNETGLQCRIIERELNSGVAWQDELYVINGNYAKSCSWI